MSKYILGIIFSISLIFTFVAPVQANTCVPLIRDECPPELPNQCALACCDVCDTPPEVDLCTGSCESADIGSCGSIGLVPGIGSCQPGSICCNPSSAACPGGTCTSQSTCTQISGTVGPGSCSSGVCCITESNGGGGNASPLCDGIGVDTALGCLHAGDPKLLIIEILNWAVVLGVGIAFLMIIFAGFQIATAAGDPKRVKAGQELITSAISGLLLIIFSVVLLNFIGVELLGLPGFVGNPAI